MLPFPEVNLRETLLLMMQGRAMRTLFNSEASTSQQYETGFFFAAPGICVVKDYGRRDQDRKIN